MLGILLLRKFEADRMVDYSMAPRCFGLCFWTNQNAAMEVSLNFPKKKILSVASDLVQHDFRFGDANLRKGVSFTDVLWVREALDFVAF